MALPKVAALIADRLNATGIKWMATGSIAAMSYGEYCVTNDIDIVLLLAGSNIDKLVAAFPSRNFIVHRRTSLRSKLLGMNTVTLIWYTTKLDLRLMFT